MARQVLGAVGAGVGFLFGGAAGAQWGWMIGSAIGNAVDPQVIPGPRIGEIANQTSQEGVPRPIVFGLSPPIAGNIISTSEPRIVTSTESTGKGGPKVETESVFRTYAIGVCEGPITGFVRIWRNGILVFDLSDDPIVDVADNAAFLETARFFLGEYDQDPSPDLEVIHGAGTTPAHRGTAFMVMADEDLTDLRGAIPQWNFQVARCEGYFGLVYISDQALHNVSDSGPVYAGFQFNANGDLEFAQDDGTWSTAGVPIGQWQPLGSQQHYIRITLNSGALSTGVTDTWLSTASSPSATVVRSTVGVNNANVTVEMATDPDGLNIVAVATYDIEAELESGVGVNLYDFESYWSRAFQPGFSASAHVNFNNYGSIYRNNSFSADPVASDTWYNPNPGAPTLGAAYDIRCSAVLSGAWSVAAAAVGTWVTLNTSREWRVNRSSSGAGVGITECVATFEIRPTGPNAPIASCTVTVRAEIT